MTGTGIETIESASTERIRARLEVRVDPTGETVEFALTTGSRTEPDSGDWVAGIWEGSWDSRNGRVDALSPPTNSVAAVTLVQDSTYDVWVRWGPLQSETPVLQVGSFLAR